MELKDFESHQIWVVLADCDHQLSAIQGSDDRISSVVETEIRARLAWFRSVYRSRSRSHFLFTPNMLSSVGRPLLDAFNSIESALQYDAQNRIAYAEQARTYIEQALEAAVRDWPAPTPTAREVDQGQSIVDSLLAAQVKALDSLDEAYSRKKKQLADLDQTAVELAENLATAEAQIEEEVDRAVAAVEAQRARIDKVIDDGTKRVADMSPRLDIAFDGWIKTQNDRFDAIFDPRVRSADASAGEAKAALSKILDIQEKYQKLVHLETADRLAGHYDREARGLRIAAIVAYFIGVSAIVVAAVPLGVLIGAQFSASPEQAAAPYNWGTLATRGLFAVLLGGVATVAVRVASRLLGQASACKRFAMEMRTFEPFLSGAEEGAVNEARLALVTQAFGKAYVGAPVSSAPGDSGEEVVHLNALEKVVDLMTKLASRGA